MKKDELSKMILDPKQRVFRIPTPITGHLYIVVTGDGKCLQLDGLSLQALQLAREHDGSTLVVEDARSISEVEKLSGIKL